MAISNINEPLKIQHAFSISLVLAAVAFVGCVSLNK
jgi:hypothetical protein